MAEPGVARVNQAGRAGFQMEPLGISTTFLTDKLQSKVEHEDEDDYDWVPALQTSRLARGLKCIGALGGARGES